MSAEAMVALLALATASLLTGVGALVHSAFSFGKVIAAQEALKTNLTECRALSQARSEAIDRRFIRLENVVLIRRVSTEVAEGG